MYSSATRCFIFLERAKLFSNIKYNLLRYSISEMEKVLAEKSRLFNMWRSNGQNGINNWLISRNTVQYVCTSTSTLYSVVIEEGFIQKTRKRSSLLFGGQNVFNSLPRLLFCTRMIWRKWLIVPGWYEEKDEFFKSSRGGK